MQDNVLIYITGIIKEWFGDNNISLLEQPLYSPDLNLIKIIQAQLKEWITTNYLDLINIGTSEAAYQRLYQAIREGWESIP